MLKGYTRKFKPLDLHTEDEVQAIHQGALNVLENAGMRLEHDRALQVYADGGCQVDFEEKRGRFPSGLVEECLRECPSISIK